MHSDTRKTISCEELNDLKNVPELLTQLGLPPLESLGNSEDVISCHLESVLSSQYPEEKDLFYRLLIQGRIVYRWREWNNQCRLLYDRARGERRLAFKIKTD
jgi:hypothetical protein